MQRDRGPQGSRPAPPDRPAPPHHRIALIALVAGGGALGTALRAELAALVPGAGGWSWIILAINVVGAFALGLLLDALAHRGPDEGRRRTVRLLVGTGVLGGFTTYSTLALDVAGFLRDGRWDAGSADGVISVALGVAAVFIGIAVAGRLRPRDPGRRRPPAPTGPRA